VNQSVDDRAAGADTTPGLELVDHVTGDDFAWITPRGSFVASGSAAEYPLDEVHDRLADMTVEDEVGAPGTGAVACGALPFDPSRHDSVMLRVPTSVTGVTASGTWWRTTVAGGNDDLHVSTAYSAAPDALRDRAEVPQPGTARSGRTGTATSLPDRDGWARMVAAALAQIRRGELTKVVLAREVVVELGGAAHLGAVLGHLASTTHGAFVFSDRSFVGASPELLIRRSGPHVESQPMAGSVPVSADDATAATSLAALTRSGKDRDEHRVVVEAVADVLADHSLRVDVPDAPELVRLPSVAHLATRITAELPATTPGEAVPSALDLALLLHPTPAVGGTPRDRAVALIDVLEPFDRGRYAGPVGWVRADGDGEWAVALRCGLLDGALARLFAGAGIVSGSDPDREWDETEAKLAPMLSALGVPRPVS